MSFISSKRQEDISIISGGKNTVLDSICPSYLDMTNPKYIAIDDYFASALLVVDYSKEMHDAFLKTCVSLDLDLQISMFYEKKNSYEVIKELTYNIGNTGANMRVTNENQTDIDVMGSSYQDAKYIRKQLQLGGEEFYYLYTYIVVYANSKEELEFDLQKLEGVLAGIGLTSRRAAFREEQAFLSAMPLMQNHKDLKEVTARNVLTSGLVSTYPFISNELCDENGVVIGINDSNHSLVMVDRFETEKYRNANMCILGTSGSGKSYFVKLMIARNRYLNINQYIIDPDREYVGLCEKLGGTLIQFGGENSINIMDIRKSSNDDTASMGYLRNKLGKLKIFFQMLLGDMSVEEEALLEEKIVECYAEKGITFDDNSLFVGSDNGSFLEKRKFRDSSEMPTISDLYAILKKDKKAKRLAALLKPMLSGSLKFLNQHTNVDLSNKLVIADIYDIEENALAPVMFVVTDFFWDKIKEERAQKKILYFDEAWRLIANNEETANFVFKIFKTIRKYGGAATAITQDVNDFLSLQDGKFGKGIMNNSSIKCMFQIEQNAINSMKEIASLSEEECYRLKNMERGTCLLHADKSHLMVKVEASKKEHDIITTDRKDLEMRGKI
ncbi:MAG: ATP-binding protein [Clostridia bacterium]|nr:ATP-binding protein [Clostridia bacterium]